MQRKHIAGWLLIWGLLDLLCALLCEIHADEAYYRLYGQCLDWGYFDHPPMVGLMTWMSASIVPATNMMLKNLSVRLVTVLLHVFTVYTIWQTVHNKVPIRFLLVAASIPMFCAYGFITTPDAPLLFFAALFYYAYKRFTEREEWSMTVLLGISMAGMLYSKYIAVLVIGFTVLGNLRLLISRKAWIAVGMTVVLLMPLLWWQYAHQFPSFTYHLVSRATSYNPLYTLEFIPNQWAVFNPLVWGLMLWLGARQIRYGDAFNRSLGTTVLGLQVFFLIMSYRGHVEPHWTIVSAIPAILLIVDDSVSDYRGVRICLGVFAVLVLAARVVLALNILPERTGLANKQPYYEQLHRDAQGLPVVFDGSFQKPSLYRFYYDDQAVLVRRATDRYTQFDIWHWEKELVGHPACVRRHGRVYITDSLSKEDLRE